MTPKNCLYLRISISFFFVFCYCFSASLIICTILYSISRASVCCRLLYSVLFYEYVHSMLRSYATSKHIHKKWYNKLRSSNEFPLLSLALTASVHIDRVTERQSVEKQSYPFRLIISSKWQYLRRKQFQSISKLNETTHSHTHFSNGSENLLDLSSE